MTRLCLLWSRCAEAEAVTCWRLCTRRSRESCVPPSISRRGLDALVGADGCQCAAEVTTVGHSPRLLAVIVNVETGDCEEGLLIVLSRPSSPVIEACLPIYQSFQLALEQSPVPAELDADGRPRPSRQSRKLVSLADVPALVTTFSNEHDASVSVVASSVDDLTDIVKETQRLYPLSEGVFCF